MKKTWNKILNAVFLKKMRNIYLKKKKGVSLYSVFSAVFFDIILID